MADAHTHRFPAGGITGNEVVLAGSSRASFVRYAWFVLAFNVAVVIWGAYVRASGSGAGCGNHWPLCNGVVLPHTGQAATAIEFAHRITSGIALILVAILTFFAFRVYPKRHIVRRTATLAIIFELMEGLIGASLVLLGHVAANQSIQRGYSLSIHLANTFLLLASLSITAWLGGHERDPGNLAWRENPRLRRFVIVTAIGILLIGITGAIAALGDTLFASKTLTEGIQQDFNVSAHPFVRARILHPFVAISLGIYVIVAVLWALRSLRPDEAGRKLGMTLMMLVAVQFCIGAMNVAWLAPIPVQLIHLLGADLLWITFVLFSTEVVTATRPAAA